MTSPEAKTAATEAELLRAELRRAETRVQMLREANAALERKLLRPTSFGKRVLAAVLAGLLTATLAHAGAAHLADARAARELDLREKRNAALIADQRTIADGCNASLQETVKELDRCETERDAYLLRARERRPASEPAAVKCACQPGDPLCSCL